MKKLFAFVGFSLLFIAACSKTEAPPAVLDAPSNFAASPADTSINLSWDAVTDATSYMLQKSSDGTNFTDLKEVTGLVYEDLAVVAGVEYSYQLYAKNDKTQSSTVKDSAIILIVSTCGPLVQEAEEADLVGGNFVVADDIAGGNASGGKYVHIPDGGEPGNIPDSILEVDSANYMEFCFTVDTAGDYMIKTWVAGMDDSDDSFWVSVDDKPAYNYSFKDVASGTAKNVQAFPLFTEDYVKDQGKGDVSITLEAGEHTVRFHHRESDARLDKLELELVPAAN